MVTVQNVIHIRLTIIEMFFERGTVCKMFAQTCFEMSRRLTDIAGHATCTHEFVKNTTGEFFHGALFQGWYLSLVVVDMMLEAGAICLSL